jgi:membrane protein
MIYFFFVINFVVSFGIITVLFAMIYKILPDVEIGWKSVWIGAAITALLFEIGRFALGIYFGNSDPASAFGAAGSVILILLWVSYSCLILFFGAQFTKVYAQWYGHGIKPSSHAMKRAELIMEREKKKAEIFENRRKPKAELKKEAEM